MAGGEIPGKVLGKGEVDASASIAVQETHSGMGLDNFNCIMLHRVLYFPFQATNSMFLKKPYSSNGGEHPKHFNRFLVLDRNQMSKLLNL